VLHRVKHRTRERLPSLVPAASCRGIPPRARIPRRRRRSHAGASGFRSLSLRLVGRRFGKHPREGLGDCTTAPDRDIPDFPGCRRPRFGAEGRSFESCCASEIINTVGSYRRELPPFLLVGGSSKGLARGQPLDLLSKVRADHNVRGSHGRRVARLPCADGETGRSRPPEPAVLDKDRIRIEPTFGGRPLSRLSPSERGTRRCC